MRAWPVVEKNDLILIYHDAEGRSPAYEIPDVPEVGAEGWSYALRSLVEATRPLARHERELRRSSALQIHPRCTLDIPNIETKTEGTCLPHRCAHGAHERPRRLGGRGSPLYQRLTDRDSRVVNISGFIDTIEMNTSTPIDEEFTETSFLCTARTDGEASQGAPRRKDREGSEAAIRERHTDLGKQGRPGRVRFCATATDLSATTGNGCSSSSRRRRSTLGRRGPTEGK